MKYTYDDYSEGNCTKEQYYEQFNPIELELGKVYLQANLGKWAETHYKIIFKNDSICLGISVYCAIGPNYSIGDYALFNTKTGFKYNDSRIETYQLREIIK